MQPGTTKVHPNGVRSRGGFFDDEVLERRNSMFEMLESVTDTLKRHAKIRLPTSNLNQTFDGVLVLLLLFTATVTPFEVAFVDADPLALPLLFALNRIVDIGFFFDIFLQFTTARLDPKSETGGYIKDRWMIAKMYLSSTFIIDFVSTMPWDLLTLVIGTDTNTDAEAPASVKLIRFVKLLKLAKMVRLARSSRAFTSLKARLHYSSSTWELIKYLLLLLSITHWIACGWGLFPQFNDNELGITYDRDLNLNTTHRLLKGGGGGSGGEAGSESPDTNWIQRTERSFQLPIGSFGAFGKYALSIDYALGVMCMGYGTVSANSIEEVVFSCWAMLIAGSAYAYVIGGVCEALANQDPAETEFRHSLDKLHGFFRKHKVPNLLKMQCMNYMKWKRVIIEAETYRSTLSELSPGLNMQLSHCLLKQLVDDRRITKFAPHNEYQHFGLRLASVFEQTVYDQGEVIFTPARLSDKLYIVERGLVRTISKRFTIFEGSRYALAAGDFKIFTSGSCVGFDMIRNVAFCAGDGAHKYRRFEEAGSLGMAMLLSVSASAFREILEDDQLGQTKKRLRNCAAWVLVYEYVIHLGHHVRAIKAAAGIPPMTRAMRRLVLHRYKTIAKQRAEAAKFQDAFKKTKGKAAAAALAPGLAEQESGGEEGGGRGKDENPLLTSAGHVELALQAMPSLPAVLAAQYPDCAFLHALRQNGARRQQEEEGERGGQGQAEAGALLDA
jgi:hypothetical protein